MTKKEALENEIKDEVSEYVNATKLENSLPAEVMKFVTMLNRN